MLYLLFHSKFGDIFVYIYICLLKAHKILPVCILVFHWEILKVYDYMTIGIYTEQNGIK